MAITKNDTNTLPLKSNETDFLFLATSLSQSTNNGGNNNELEYQQGNQSGLNLSPLGPHDNNLGDADATKVINEQNGKKKEFAVEIDDPTIDQSADSAWFEYCYDSSIQFLTGVFLNQNQSVETKMIHVHVTNATNRESLQELMQEIQDIVVWSMFRTHNMM